MTEHNLIKHACKELGITQKELADLIGASEGTVRQWSSKGTPEWADKSINHLLEIKNLKNQLESATQFKQHLKDFIDS